jgi:hypothetical protein
MRKYGLGIIFVLILTCFSFSGEKIWKKLKIELYGGLSSLNPTDLNLWSDMNEKTDKFYNDDYFGYRTSQNSNFSYTKIKNGDIPWIKNAFLLGLRLKFELNNHIGISLGFKRLSREHNHEVSSAWTFPYDYGEYQYRIVYSPYTLSVRGNIPSLGIYFRIPLEDRITAGVLIEAGPIFGQCILGYDYYEEWLSDEGYLMDRSSKRYLEEIGEGTGFVLEGGLRISIKMGNFFPFLEGSYAYQKVENLSGPGTERFAFLEKSWEGEWGIKQGTTSREWGELIYEYPSNSWEGSGGKHRDFNLNLSGFQFRIGIGYSL